MLRRVGQNSSMCIIFCAPPIDVWCMSGARHERAPIFFSPEMFSVNIGKFLRTPILKNICKWLLLWVAIIYFRKQHFITTICYICLAIIYEKKKTILLLAVNNYVFKTELLNLLAQVCLSLLIVFQHEQQFLWISTKCFCDVNTRKYFQLCNNLILSKSFNLCISHMIYFKKQKTIFLLTTIFLGLSLLLELHH